jgi:hypothetical protein
VTPSQTHADDDHDGGPVHHASDLDAIAMIPMIVDSHDRDS